VACGSLPERDENLAKFERWLDGKKDQVTHPEHHMVLELYVRWHLLRIMRARAKAGPVPDGSFLTAKQHTTVAIDFLNWLEDRGKPLEQCSQHDIDAWFAEGPTTRRHAANLMWWAMHQRLLPELRVPTWTARTSPALGQQERIGLLRMVLLDEELPNPLRVIACLVLLYGQPSRARIRAAQRVPRPLAPRTPDRPDATQPTNQLTRPNSPSSNTPRYHYCRGGPYAPRCAEQRRQAIGALACRAGHPPLRSSRPGVIG
jgi:hypothetical protein